MNPSQKIRRYLNQGLAIGILLLLSACSAWAQGVQGTWQGTLHASNGDLPLVFHLGANGSGTVDSPAQNFHGPLQYSVTGNQITITVSSVNGTYSGTVNGKQMNGTWSQNGQGLPLALTKQ
jgi:hypothetical protein